MFLARPSPTGGRRWGAFLAGVTEEMAARGDSPLPRRTDGVGLQNEWFVADDPACNEYLRSHAPDPFRSRGVMIDPDALESA